MIMIISTRTRSISSGTLVVARAVKRGSPNSSTAIDGGGGGDGERSGSKVRLPFLLMEHQHVLQVLPRCPESGRHQ